MAIVAGEAKYDASAKKWYWVVYSGSRELGRSGPTFSTQAEAESELIKVLQKLLAKSKE